MTKTARRMILLLGVTFVAGIVAGFIVIRSPLPQKSVLKASKPVIRVLTLGGSVARGWRDTGWQHWRQGWYGGYLVRGFAEFSHENAANYRIINHTIVGANSSQMNTLYKGEYQHWLRKDSPQVVAISWGLLNDALPKTPLPTFVKNLRQEITQALQAHAVVFVITPPVTAASQRPFKNAFMKYLDSELTLIRDLHNPNVYALDIYESMLAEIKTRDIAISTLSANSWHPNAKGHELAGAILANELKQQFGESEIVFHR